MKKNIFVFMGLLVCLLCTVAAGIAGVPQRINLQGRLTDAQGDTLSGEYDMRFTIYADSSAETLLWQESWLTIDGRPVKVRAGIFNVLLGSYDSISDTVFTGAERWLGMKVEGDEEMRPLQPIASVGYAFHSATSDTARTATPDGDWIIDGDNIYHEQGNVGIGTTDPDGELHVVGNIKATKIGLNDADPDPTYSIYTTNRHAFKSLGLYHGHMIFIDHLGGPDGYFPRIYAANGDSWLSIWAQDGIDIEVDKNVNNSSTPFHLKHGSLVALKMIKSTEVGNFRPIFVFGDEDFDLSSKVVIQGLGTGNILRLDDYSGDTKAVFTNAGNVGIGITNPQRTLHIKDVLRLEPQASAPSGGLGDLYVGTDGKLYFHNGNAWKEVQLAP